jgi:hypothetical protein
LIGHGMLERIAMLGALIVRRRLRSRKRIRSRLNVRVADYKQNINKKPPQI